MIHLRKLFYGFREICKRASYGVEINPMLFEEFEISVVPSFVIAKGEGCDDGSDCNRKYNKLAGNVKTSWAFEKLMGASYD